MSLMQEQLWKKQMFRKCRRDYNELGKYFETRRTYFIG